MTAKAWRRVCDELDGDFRRSPLSFDVTLERVAITVSEQTIERRNEARQTFTRIVAATDTPPDLRIRAYRNGGLPWSRGVLPVVEGWADEAFRDGFTVEASSEEGARQWMNQAVRQALVDLDGYSFRLLANEAELVRPGLEPHVEYLHEAIEGMLECADGRQSLLPLYEQLARELDGEAARCPYGWVRMSAGLHDVNVEIDQRMMDGRWTTVVLAEKSVPDRGDGEGERSSEMRATLDRLQPVDFGDEPDVVWLALDGIAPSLPIVRDAATFVASLARRPGRGPYR